MNIRGTVLLLVVGVLVCSGCGFDCQDACERWADCRQGGSGWFDLWPELGEETSPTVGPCTDACEAGTCDEWLDCVGAAECSSSIEWECGQVCGAPWTTPPS